MISRRSMFGAIAGLAAAPMAFIKSAVARPPTVAVDCGKEEFWCSCGKRSNDMYRLIALHDGEGCVRLADAEFTNVEEMKL